MFERRKSPAPIMSAAVAGRCSYEGDFHRHRFATLTTDRVNREALDAISCQLFQKPIP